MNHMPVAKPGPWPSYRLVFNSKPHYLHRTLAQVLGIETHDIRLIKPDVGAGYGGKCDAFSTDICAAYLAKKLNRPVKAQFTREGVFYAHRGRHPVKMRLKMAAMSDGTITAAELEAIADGGAYASYGVVTSYYLAFSWHALCIPNLKTSPPIVHQQTPMRPKAPVMVRCNHGLRLKCILMPG